MAIVDKINAFTGEHSETIEDSLKNLSEIKKLPEVTAEDNGKVLSVVEGEWAKAEASGGGGVVFLTSKIVSNPNYDSETSDPSEMFYTYIFNGDAPVYVSEILAWMREGKLVYVAQNSNDPDNHLNTFTITNIMMSVGYHPMDHVWYAECFTTSMYELGMNKYTGVSSYYDDEGTQIELPDNEFVFQLSFSKSTSFPD